MLRIVSYPHPALRHPAKPIQALDKKVRIQAGEMFEAMYDAKGLGLAATQVALPYQLLVMNIEGDPEKKEAERVYINPTIIARKGIMDGEEGCLSFPGLFVPVKRAKRVTVSAYDLEGNPVTIEAEGLAARAWQHEIDHLLGVVFIDRFSTLSKVARARDIRAFETAFRREQEEGRIPPDAELERLLHDLEQEWNRAS